MNALGSIISIKRLALSPCRSIGVLFYLGQSVATALYVVGFAESLVQLYETVRAAA